MCAACVAQGIAYVGGALTGLQVMAVRASAKRRRGDYDPEPGTDTAPPSDQADEPVESEPTPV